MLLNVELISGCEEMALKEAWSPFRFRDSTNSLTDSCSSGVKVPITSARFSTVIVAFHSQYTAASTGAALAIDIVVAVLSTADGPATAPVHYIMDRSAWPDFPSACSAPSRPW